MALRDIRSNISSAHSLAPAEYTANATGTGVDLRGYDSAMVVIHAGAYTDGTHVFQIEESDDDSNYTAVADADLQGSEPTIDSVADDNSTFEIGYIGNSRYIRVTVGSTGTTSGTAYGVSVIRGHAHSRPA